MHTITVPSPAKINLFLHVNGRRADGYHHVQTAFQFLELADRLTFALRPDQSISLKGDLSDIPVEANLIYKAATLLQQHNEGKQGVEIEIEKNIPIGGGLGGGSSNAATTMLILNKLWGCHLATQELMTMAVKLGADVPIFISGLASFAEGIGEQLQPIHPPERWLLLVIPPVTVNTGKIFSDTQLTRTTPKITIAEFLERGGHNDCEPVTRKHFPEVADALDWLNNYSLAKLTGTGSCVFALFEDKNAALNAIKEIPDRFKGFVVKGLNISPLHSVIENFNWGVAKW